MGTVQVLAAVEAGNAILSLVINGMTVLQQINQVIQHAHQTGLPIPQSAWDDLVANADAADKRLADAIKSAQGQAPATVPTASPAVS